MASRRAINRLIVAATLLIAAAANAETTQPGAEPLTIVAFGDSLTAGYGLPAEQGFAPRLEAWLAAEGAPEVTVINAGVSGDTSAGALDRLDFVVPPEADAVILEIGANDMLRGWDPALPRKNIDAMLGRLGERGVPVLLAGMRSLANWGEDYAADFESIYPDLSEKHSALYYPFFLEGVAGDPALSQDDMLHPNAAGVDVIVENIGPMVLNLIDQARAREAE